MARDHARIQHRIWSDEKFRALGESSQRAFFLALSQPGLNYCGVVPYTLKRWSSLSRDSTVSKLRKALTALQEARFVVVDEDAEEVLIRSFVKNDGLLSSPNICINVVKTYPSILSARLKAVFLIELHRLNEAEQASGWEKGWTHLAPLLAEPFPEGLPEGFLEGFFERSGEPIPKALLSRVRDATRAAPVLSCPTPVLSPASPLGTANPSGQPTGDADPAEAGAALARELMASRRS